MGIDIPVSRFEAFAPKSHLGPLGYPFAINTNGFLIFHPNLWMIANYLEDPAHNVSQLIWVHCDTYVPQWWVELVDYEQIKCYQINEI